MSTVHSRKSQYIAYWLFGVAGLVFAMMIIGAITRLTESGLSMVEWRPLIGALPPMSEEEWTRVFNLYKETPEFQKKNFWMSEQDFRTIFFWEWFHRLWGRLIGIAYAVPFFIFLAKGWIPKGFKLKLTGLLVLGGMQGLMGWYMVQSGLIDMPAVSHYRLAAHLGLAFLIFALLIWTGLSIKHHNRWPSRPLFYHGLLTLAVLSLTIVWGAFVAGLDAGLVYNEFPLMGDHIVPYSDWRPELGWHNIHESHGFVQFTHRALAVLSLLVVLSFWLHGMIQKHMTSALAAVMILCLLQVGLGIATLLSQVSIVLATLHQGVAALLVGMLILAIYEFRRKRQDT